MKVRHCLFLLAMIAAMNVASTAYADGERVPKAVFIGVDGVRPDALIVADTPNIDRLIANGTFDPRCLILGERYQKNDTISGPGWSSIFTGVWADKHGVHDNSFAGRKYDEHPHFFAHIRAADPDAETISLVASWIPIEHHIVSDASVREFFPVGGPGGDRMAREKQANVDLTEKAVQLLTENDPTAVSIYLSQPDIAGHTFGFNAHEPEYLKAIENTDRHVGDIMKAIRSRPAYKQEDWIIVMTTDHGGYETGHGGGHENPEILHGFFLVSGEAVHNRISPQQTYIVDVVPTLLEHLGAIDSEIDGRPIGLRELTTP
ncbi:MAG: alkaline phosphatase family protein [Phycisphaeraceae bacterium]